jgi:hypothetical protein
MAEELPRTSPKSVKARVGDPRIADVCGKPLLKPPTKGGFFVAPSTNVPAAHFNYNTPRTKCQEKNRKKINK